MSQLFRFKVCTVRLVIFKDDGNYIFSEKYTHLDKRKKIRQSLNFLSNKLKFGQFKKKLLQIFYIRFVRFLEYIV